MGLEIERKFLVKNDTWKKVTFKQIIIKQGYLNSNKNRTVRIRISDNQGFITVKGVSNDSGTTRFEWEKEIDVQEANQLLAICEPNIIEKTRYLVKNGIHIFEIDEFFGANKGLLIAEIELTSENETFEKPSWLGKEVTGNPIYYNASLSKLPFSSWE